MSSVAQKQDLSDPEVVRRFADIVQSERRLVALYLLTVADIRGTSPKVWNAWKSKLLEDLFNATSTLLKGGRLEADQYIQSEAGRGQAAAQALRAVRHDPGRAVEELRRALFPAPRRPGDRLAHAHAALADQRRAAGGEGAPVARGRGPAGDDLRPRPERPVRAHLRLLRVGRPVSIVDAKIYTTRHGFALDTFQVMDVGNMPHPRDMISKIEEELAAWLAEAGPAAAADSRDACRAGSSISRSRPRCASSRTRRASITRSRSPRATAPACSTPSRWCSQPLRHQPAQRQDRHAGRARRGRAGGLGPPCPIRRPCCSSRRTCSRRCSLSSSTTRRPGPAPGTERRRSRTAT